MDGSGLERIGRNGKAKTGEARTATEWQEWSGADRRRMDWRGQAGMERTGKESRGTEWQEGNVKERNGASRKGKE